MPLRYTRGKPRRAGTRKYGRFRELCNLKEPHDKELLEEVMNPPIFEEVCRELITHCGRRKNLVKKFCLDVSSFPVTRVLRSAITQTWLTLY